MQNENTSTQMRKGTLEFCILLVISRGEVYTSDLIDELKAARFIVVEGTLYPLLNRLQKSGYLDYTWKESPSGPPRKYYRPHPQEPTSLLRCNRLGWSSAPPSI